jgi:hypothetical protein
LHKNLKFSCLLTINPLDHLPLYILLFLSIFFRNTFFIFYLEKQHPVCLEKLPMSGRFKDLFLPFLVNPFCYRVYTHVCVGVFTRTPCFLCLSPGFDCSGWSTCGCLTVFPRLKGRTNVHLFFLFDYLLFDYLSFLTIRYVEVMQLSLVFNIYSSMPETAWEKFGKS